jgi:outer membrane protein OmpA-like peptidoglycan-associated protein
VFQFEHRKDDVFRIVASSVQTAWVNHRKVQVYDQGYKAVLRVVETGKDYGRMQGKYFYMARPYGHANTAYEVLEDRIYESDFRRYGNGEIKISDRYFYPVVRDLPVFPKEDIPIGHSWKGTGYESQDFRKIGIQKPFISPFEVRYKYLKDEKYQGKDCAVVEVFYHINERFARQNIRPNRYNGLRNPVYPIRAIGVFAGKIYWDKKLNKIYQYSGVYSFVYHMSDGSVREWEGKDRGEVTLVCQDREQEKKMKEEAEQEMGKMAQVKEDEKGLKLIFSDILFDFNQIRLKAAVIPTLEKVVKILQKYAEYEVRVEGHSDDVGQQRFKEAIAKGRAKVVADYLISKGIDPARVSYRGYGDRKPLVPNTNEENRAKNRRVEIYIITK